MRMSAGTRVLLTIYLIVVICGFLFVLATMFGIIPTTYFEGIAGTAIRGGFWWKVLYAAICIVMIVVSFILMFFRSGKREPRESSVKIAEFNGGAIVITTKALEEMVQREVTNTSGVRGAHSKVISHGEFVDVYVQVSVAPGQNIPEITKELQTKLQAELQNQSGVSVRDMKLTVTDVAEAMKNSNQKAPRVV